MGGLGRHRLDQMFIAPLSSAHVNPGRHAFPAGGALLSSAEVRVLGCLLEKQRTTPDQYPLSLDALRLACNQSTNRDPAMDYDETTIRDALHRLERRRLVRFASGSRAAKYRHLLDEALPLDEGEWALMTVLMLRGVQTSGELKQRAERMHAFGDLVGVHETLERLIGHELVRRLDRQPGQKRERYEQLLQGEEEDEAADVGTERAGEAELASANAGDNTAASAWSGQGAAEDSQAEDAELQDLRERVERLEREVTELRFSMRNPSPKPHAGESP
jgi:uncharacterized protein YceH (UPF0502 family)